jgi:Bacterial TniB protein
VRLGLLLPDERRIATIDRDRWIGYGRAQDAISELERILHSERRQRPDNLLIVGASNNGKTAIARRFMARMLPAEDPGAQFSRIPVTMIQAPNGPRIPQLLSAIRAALGHPAGRRESTPRPRQETYRIMLAVGLRHAVDRRSARHPWFRRGIHARGVAGDRVGRRRIARLLRDPGDRLCPTPGRAAREPPRTDDTTQVADRGRRLLWRLLHTFGRRLPLRAPSDLTDPDLAAHILARADGLIGAVTRLSRQAAVEAVRTGHERIDRAMLDRVSTTTPATIEALAASERF